MANDRRLPPATAERQLRSEGASRMEVRGYLRRIGIALVAAQWVLAALCLLPVGPTVGDGRLRVLGLALLALGAVVGVLALVAMGRSTRVHPVPAATATLQTRGIYSFIRHPMYLAVGLCCLGVVLMSGRVLALVAYPALVATLWAKAAFEDRLLEKKFGWQFAVYASHVPAVLPQPWRSHAR